MDKLYLISYILSSNLDEINICKLILSLIYPYKQNYNECILQIPNKIKLKKLYIYFDYINQKFIYLDYRVSSEEWLPFGLSCEWLYYSHFDDYDEYNENLSKLNANFCSYKNKTLSDKYK